jgi:hypothetical protein
MKIAALALLLPFAFPQEEKQDPEARLKELERRLSEAEKLPDRVKAVVADAERLSLRIRELERRLAEEDRNRAALEKRVADAEKGAPEVQARLKELELARGALERKASEAERARAEHEAARSALEKRIADVDRARLELVKPIRDLESGRDALQKRVAEVDREVQGARTALETRVTESDRARQDQAVAIERKVGEVDRKREALVEPVRDLQSARASLEQEARSLAARLQAQEVASREGLDRALRLRSELRTTRLALLRTAVPSAEGVVYPNEGHFAFMGVVFDSLKKDASERLGLSEGEGIVLRRIDVGTPAHESDLNHGDVITRVDGVPVRSSGVRTSRNLAGPWEEHAPLPNFLVERLPGERVRIEYARGEERRQVEIELRCRACPGACPFFTP